MMKRLGLVLMVCASCAVMISACDDGDDAGDATATVSALPTVGTIAPPPTAAPTAAGTGVVPGPPDRMELTADPQELVCDGVQGSTVTARVVDEDGNPVSDGINVRFNVAALGTADPIETETVGGVATTTVVALGSGVGVVVNVAVGEVEMAIRIDCQ